MSGDRDDVALFRYLPAVGRQVPWVRLGRWPTPVEPLPSLSTLTGGEIWIKREDLTSPVYGGNKVRTLEAMLGRAQAAGARRIWATGAYGSNHAVATVLHAGAAGLDSGIIAFPQLASTPARDNLIAALSVRPEIIGLASVVQLPFAMHRVRAAPGAYVMPPGGATPEGTLGAVSAAFELAEQVALGICPPPAHLVLPVGSTCTTAGLLAGLALATELGVGFSPAQPPPRLIAVRVTPWPVTSVWRIVDLARRSLALLDRLCGRTTGIGARALRAGVDLHPEFFGGGYGRPTPGGLQAIALFRAAGAPPLDVVYSAKAGAAAIALARRCHGPLLFWATKSSAPLPAASDADLARAPSAMRVWLGRR